MRHGAGKKCPAVRIQPFSVAADLPEVDSPA
jgi:hypothetical protein